MVAIRRLKFPVLYYLKYINASSELSLRSIEDLTPYHNMNVKYLYGPLLEI
jgi:hypothetical protein